MYVCIHICVCVRVCVCMCVCVYTLIYIDMIYLYHVASNKRQQIAYHPTTRLYTHTLTSILTQTSMHTHTHTHQVRTT